MAKVLTPALIRSCYQLRGQQLSMRAIAAQLGRSHATVSRALKLPLPTLPPRGRNDRQPILLSRPVGEPQACPADAPAFVRGLYGALVQRNLLGELDCLIVAFDLDVERTHLCLSVPDADSMLCRLEQHSEPVDVAACVANLQDAFRWDEELRKWCRQVAAEHGV